MSLTSLFSKIRLSARDAEIIFDRSEPVGQPTDLILSGRRWFRSRKGAAGDLSKRVDRTAQRQTRTVSGS